MVVPPDLIMLTPLKSEFDTIWVIWVRIDRNWVLVAARLVGSSEVSEAVSASVFSWFSRFETLVPAEVATWMVDPARCSDWITAFSAPELPRSFWAMAQMAPLSCGDPTARPVETSFWVWVSSEAVAVRFWSATSAPGLLFTLSMNAGPYSQVSGVVLTAVGILPAWRQRKPRTFAGLSSSY